MTTETARLVVVASSSGTDKVKKQLDGVKTSGSAAEKATASFSSALARIAGPAAIAAAALLSLRKVTEVTRQFGILNAQLKVATGSAENAAAAFEALQDFAKETPFGLEQSTTAFVKLVNYGLTPSERALRSYGNTASSMSKTLDQMIEAVADAATGEFERLKEFGIKAKNNGDTIAFTFRGTTTSVKNNAAEIENYLIQLGENNFGTAMSEQMKTLDGAFANLSDNWDMLWLNISKTGIGDFITAQVRQAGDSIQDLNDIFASGQFDTVTTEWVQQWDGLGQAVQDFLHLTDDEMKSFKTGFMDDVQELMDNTIREFKELPANIINFVETSRIELEKWATYGSEYGKMLVNYIIGQFKVLDAYVSGFGDYLKSALTIGADADWESQVAKRVADAKMKLDQDISNNKSTIRAAEEKANRESFEAEAKRQQKLADMDIAVMVGQQKATDQANKTKPTEDRLAGFRVGGDNSGSNSSSKGGKKGGASGQKLTADSWETFYQTILQGGSDTFDQLALKEKQDLDRVDKYLKAGVASTEEAQSATNAIHEKYGKARLDIVDKYDPAAAAARKQKESNKEIEALQKAGLITEEASLSARNRLQEDFFNAQVQLEQDNAVSLEDKMRGKYDEVQEAQNVYDTQLAALQAYLEAGYVTEEDYAQRRHELYTEMLQAQAEAENAEVMGYIKSGSMLAKGMADIIKAAGAEGSGAYKVLFAASQAFSIAQATLNLSTAISQAMADPTALTPAQKFANMAAIAAAGGSLLSSIAAVGMAHDGIDEIPREGTWLLDKGERVVDSRTNADLKNFLSSGGGQGQAPQIHQTFQITGNTDAQLQRLLQQAAEQGAQQGYAMVLTDVSGSRGQVSRAIGR
ncbi:tape measure protein [Serratia phage Serbin]|uniref:Tape measure protein n=1 Tax=Serratia phage Serbin TaxID=2562181 RepID=A0A482MGD6_9CAUD|nr:tape measure protein [Serratia phage Serbin]QBQ72937.1 tape measure protein [Serratia phage Serbin]